MLIRNFFSSSKKYQRYIAIVLHIQCILEVLKETFPELLNHRIPHSGESIKMSLKIGAQLGSTDLLAFNYSFKTC